MAQSESCQIGTGVTIVGRVRGAGALHVHGTVEGEVSLDGDLVVEPSGTVRASVTVASLRLRGRIEGDIIARVGAVIEAGATMTGTLRTPSLSVQPGATLRGTIHLGDATSDPATTTDP